MKTFTFVLICFICNLNVFAQSEAFIRFSDQNKFFWNPAFTNENRTISFALLSDFSQNPYYLYAHNPFVDKSISAYGANLSLPVFSKNNHEFGIGLTTSSQINSYEYYYGNVFSNSSRISSAYSYNSKVGRFSLGTYLESFQYKGALFEPIFIDEKFSGNFNNIGIGIAYQSKNENLQLGFSSLSHKKHLILTESGIRDYSQIQYKVQAAYKIRAHKHLTILPSFLIALKNPINLNSACIMMEYKNKLTFGVSTLNDFYLVGIRLGYKLKELSVQYNFNTASIYFYNSTENNHSIGLFYTFQKKTN